ncbi:LOW QUALITY PROTEIN: hypothetical protein ACHAWU_004489 [Discostella pseudostelligera]|uniref:Uncharacterized protein n=1 Tax=Discostella pseudostelligera TaxID=259834 RepID=A0ABD3M0Z6_9STRA
MREVRGWPVDDEETVVPVPRVNATVAGLTNRRTSMFIFPDDKVPTSTVGVHSRLYRNRG